MVNRINCPLMNEEIEDTICFDICMVVEDDAPLWTAPKKATQVNDFKKICLNCPNHRDD